MMLATMPIPISLSKVVLSIQVNKKSYEFKKESYRDCIKRKGNKIGSGLRHFLTKKDFFTSQTLQCKKVLTLRMHVHLSISMTTINQKWPQVLLNITTSSLLKHANYTMHEGETDFSVSIRAMTKNGLGHFSL